MFAFCSVCGGGEWVCTQVLCSTEDGDNKKGKDPEDDPDVQDINWF